MMKDHTDNELIDWLLDGPAWVATRVRVDMLEQPEDNPHVVQALSAALAAPEIQALVTELMDWPGPVLKSHKKAGHLLHKLGFLADLGYTVDDPSISGIVERILDHQSPGGPFHVRMNIHTRWGGSGEDESGWMLCDAPLVTTAMVKFGLGDLTEVQDSRDHLVSLVKENGWPCCVSPEFGKFRGPGRKTDPCPYATLVMLKLLAQFPEKYEDAAVKIGIETILSLWEHRKESRPYLFAMGTDFSKLKAPLIWYDLLHVTDVLTHFPWVLHDKRLQEMVRIVKSQADQDSRFKAKSIWMDWKSWEFGQKKEPSRWITLMAHRIFKRTKMI